MEIEFTEFLDHDGYEKVHFALERGDMTDNELKRLILRCLAGYREDNIRNSDIVRPPDGGLITTVMVKVPANDIEVEIGYDNVAQIKCRIRDAPIKVRFRERKTNSTITDDPPAPPSTETAPPSTETAPPSTEMPPPSTETAFADAASQENNSQTIATEKPKKRGRPKATSPKKRAPRKTPSKQK